MTTTQTSEARAEELERKADTLRMAMLAPSMREDALRQEAAELRGQCCSYVELEGDYYRAVCDGCRWVGEPFTGLTGAQDDAAWHDADALEKARVSPNCPQTTE